MEKVKTKTSSMRQGLVDKLATDKPGTFSDLRTNSATRSRESTKPRPPQAHGGQQDRVCRRRQLHRQPGRPGHQLLGSTTPALAYLGTKPPGSATRPASAHAPSTTRTSTPSRARWPCSNSRPADPDRLWRFGRHRARPRNNDTPGRVSDSAVRTMAAWVSRACPRPADLHGPGHCRLRRQQAQLHAECVPIR